MRENVKKRQKRVVAQRKPATKSTEEGDEEEPEAKEESVHPSKFVKTPKKMRQMTNEEKNEVVNKMDDRAFDQHCLTTLKENSLAKCGERELCNVARTQCAIPRPLFHIRSTN